MEDQISELQEQMRTMSDRMETKTRDNRMLADERDQLRVDLASEKFEHNKTSEGIAEAEEKQVNAEQLSETLVQTVKSLR